MPTQRLPADHLVRYGGEFLPGMLINVVQLPGVGNGTFRIAPPLIAERGDVDLAIAILDQAITETYGKMPVLS